MSVRQEQTINLIQIRLSQRMESQPQILPLQSICYNPGNIMIPSKKNEQKETCMNSKVKFAETMQTYDWIGVYLNFKLNSFTHSHIFARLPWIAIASEFIFLFRWTGTTRSFPAMIVRIYELSNRMRINVRDEKEYFSRETVAMKQRTQIRKEKKANVMPSTWIHSKLVFHRSTNLYILFFLFICG